VLNEADSKTCFTEKDPGNSGEKIVCSFAGVREIERFIRVEENVLLY
jgi:hypothetical protein